MAGRVGERRRRVEGGRQHRYSVRLTDGENTLVSSAAEAAGLSVPHLIAETVLLSLTRRDRLALSDRRALAGELAALRRYLRAVGVNVNQVARVANSTGQMAPEVVPTAEAVRRAVARLEAVLRDLEGFGLGEKQ